LFEVRKRGGGGAILLHLCHYRNDTFGPYLDYALYTLVDFVLGQKFSGGHKIGLIGDRDLNFVFQMKNISGALWGTLPKIASSASKWANRNLPTLLNALLCVKNNRFRSEGVRDDSPPPPKLNRVFLIIISYRYIQNFVTILLVSFSKYFSLFCGKTMIQKKQEHHRTQST
jgi:hypothetical protein